MFSRLDTIPACDRQTNRQTPHDGKDRVMQSVARVKTVTMQDTVYGLNITAS